MPMVTIDVLRVEPVWRVVKGVQTRKFIVWPQPPNRHAYETWSALFASACERAGQIGQSITLWTRDTKFGPEIVNVEMLEQVPHVS